MYFILKISSKIDFKFISQNQGNVIFIKILIFIITFFIINFKLQKDSKKIKDKSKKLYILILFFILLNFLNFKTSDLNSKIINKYLGQKDIILQSDGTVNYIESKISGEFLIKKIKDKKYNMVIEAYSLEHQEKTLMFLKKQKSNSQKVNFKLGDIIKVKGLVKHPNKSRNPKTFNYRNYLKSRKIYSNIEIQNIKKITKSKNRGIKLRLKFNSIVERALEQMKNEKNRKFLKSVITGDNSFVDKEDIERINKLGISHLIAVSGFHIGLIFTGMTFILKKFSNKRISTNISLIISFIYISIIDFPISSIRAFLMILILNLGIILEKRIDTANILGFVGVLILIFNPQMIYNLGFILSFTGVLSILFFSNQISTKNKIMKNLSLIIGIFLGTTPININHFNYFSISSIVSNIIAVLPFSIALYTSIIGILIFPLTKELSKLSFLISNEAIDIMNRFLDMFYIKGIEMNSMSFIETILIYFIIISSIYFEFYDVFSYKLKKDIFKILIFNLIIIIGSNIIFENKQASIKFIDIGQGNSAIVTFNNKNYIFDTGENNVIEYLIKNESKDIDGLIISHFHSDHIKDAAEIIKRLNVKSIYLSHLPLDNKFGKEIFIEAKKKNSKIIIVNNQKNIKHKGLSIRLIPPSQQILKGDNENEKSLVALVTVNGRKIMFTGDIEKEAEKNLCKETLPKIDILNVPHHGSLTSSSEEFLKKINPSIAVFQTGISNKHSHPEKKILERYQNINATIARNDLNGLIEFKIDKNSKIRRKNFINNGTKKDINTIFKSIEYIMLIAVYIMIIFNRERLVIYYLQMEK